MQGSYLNYREQSLNETENNFEITTSAGALNAGHYQRPENSTFANSASERFV